jgi:hypothetical protein
MLSSTVPPLVYEIHKKHIFKVFERVSMIFLTKDITLNYFAGEDGCSHIMENLLVLGVM